MLSLIRRHTQMKRTSNSGRANNISDMVLSYHLITNLDFSSLMLFLYTKRALMKYKHKKTLS
jgi:hypothetical protein